MKEIIIIVLKSMEYLICQYDELESSDRILVHNAFLLNGKDKVTLTPFPKYSLSRSCVIFRESILTIVDTVDVKMIQIYLSKVGENILYNSDTPTPKRPKVIDTGHIELFTEDEPRYVEIDDEEI